MQNISPSPMNLKSLAAVLFCGLLLRLALLAWFSGVTPMIVDEQDYVALAEELAVSGNYADQVGYTSLRPPLYPAMLAEVYRLTGLQTPDSRQMDRVYHSATVVDGITVIAPEGRHAGMKNHQAVRFLQIFISLATACAVYFTARLLPEVVPEKAAVLAAAFCCFYPSLVGENFMILSETVFIFFLVMVIFCGVKYFRTGSLLAAAFMGVFIALGALTRSILWMAPIPLAVFILCFGKPFTLKNRSAAAFLLVLFAGMMMAPWMIRNTKIQETFTAIDCMSGRNLMMGNYEHTPLYNAWAAIQIPYPDDWNTILAHTYARETGQRYYKLTQGQRDKLAGRYAVDFMMKNPGLTLKRDAVKACCFWQLERSFPAGAVRNMFGFERFPGESRKIAVVALAAVIIPAYVFLLVSAVFGIFSWKPSGGEENQPASRPLWLILAFLMCIIVYFWGIHALIFAHERYHLPLIPILCIFAAFFWSAPREKLSVLFSRKKRWLPACVFLLVMCVFWAVELRIAAELMRN